jgi:hypothetical protein
VLTDAEVIEALINLGQAFEDQDYGAALLGDVSLALVGSKQFEKAECVANLIKGQEKSEHLRALAEAEAKIGQRDRARTLLHQARQAAFIYEFSTQLAQSIGAVAATMEAIDKEAAVELWESAVAVAAPAQEAGGTDGPEASGVLLEAVEGLLRLGRGVGAREVASQIKLPWLRERAIELCK